MIDFHPLFQRLPADLALRQNGLVTFQRTINVFSVSSGSYLLLGRLAAEGAFGQGGEEALFRAEYPVLDPEKFSLAFSIAYGSAADRTSGEGGLKTFLGTIWFA